MKDIKDMRKFQLLQEEASHCLHYFVLFLIMNRLLHRELHSSIMVSSHSFMTVSIL